MGGEGVGRYLPQAILATALITLAPALVVWLLREGGLIEGALALIVIGFVLSLTLAWAGRAFWQRRSGSQDLLFGELMLWGWFGRWRSQRRIGDAVSLLGLEQSLAVELEPERRIEVLRQLASGLEARDPYTHGHSKRVARYAAMTAKAMGLPAASVDKIRAAAAVHDVGKLETPLEVLNKPDRLTDEEFEIIKLHAPRGAELVAALGDPELTSMVRHHHERLDGGGYPDGRAGETIPIGARIISVADTFDAITSNRAYRRSNPHRKAIEILRKEAGTQLDADAVAGFCRRYAGLRPVALYSLLATSVPRLLQPLFSGAGAATAGVASTAAGVVAATAVVGTLAISPKASEEESPAAAARPAAVAAPAARSSGRDGGGSRADSKGGAGDKQGGGGQSGDGQSGGGEGGDGETGESLPPPASSPSTPDAGSSPAGIVTPSQPGPGGVGGGGVPGPPDVPAETPPQAPDDVPEGPKLPALPDPDDLPLPELP